jgi:hypothetical protein
VDPLGVAAGHVVSEQAPEMTFAEDDHVIEKLSSACSHPPLGDRIGHRCRMHPMRRLGVDVFG